MRILALLVLLLALVLPARAQESPTPSPSPASPIPLADVATRAAEVNAWLRSVEGVLHDEALVEEVRSGLPDLEEQLREDLQQDQRLLSRDPSLDELRSRELALQGLASRLQGWGKGLGDRGAALEEQLRRLSELRETWSATAQTARAEAAPPVILGGIDMLVGSLEASRQDVQTGQGELFTLQKQLSDAQALVSDGQEALARARQARMDRALDRESPPLWNLGSSTTAPGVLERLQVLLEAQWADLGRYSAENLPNFAAWVVLFGLLVLALRQVQRQAARWMGGEPELQEVAWLLGAPVPAALLLTVALGRSAFPGAPRLWLAMLGVAAVGPAVLLLRRLLDPYLQPLLSFLVLSYLVDQVRLLAGTMPTLARLLLLGETLAALVFLAWYLLPACYASVSDAERSTVQSRSVLLARVALGLLAASTLANLFGFVALATLLGGATLRSAYSALVILAVLKLLQGLAFFALQVPPLALSAAVREHRELMAWRARQGLAVLAFLIWALVTLEAFSVRERVLAALAAVLSARLSLGVFSLSLGGLLTFVLAVWGATLVSRFLRFVLDEDVFPHLRMDRGISHALSQTLHYAVLVLGLLFALAAVGLDLTKLAVVAGALSVGIGFGLQNIVNNFVSGLILLFDRSLNLGDSLQVGGHQGELRKIGLRASTLLLGDGSELVVPNSKLIEQQVVTSPATSREPRRLELVVALAGPVEEGPVLQLLEGLARSHPDVLDTPAPLALFLGFQEGSPTFQLLAWTGERLRSSGVRSELAVGLGKALRAGGYRVAGPRREIHLDPPEAASGSLPGATSMTEA